MRALGLIGSLFLIAACGDGRRVGGDGGNLDGGPRPGSDGGRFDGAPPDAGTGRDGGGLPVPDGSSGTITQSRICDEVFRTFCAEIIPCDSTPWTTPAECEDAFRGDCCGGGCDRTRPDVSEGALSQCVAALNAAECSALYDTLDTVCDTVIWGAAL